MNLFLGIVWSLASLTIAANPLADANNGHVAGHHEMRQIAAGGLVLPGSSLVTENSIVVATASANGGLFSNATSDAFVDGVAPSAAPSFIPVNPTSHFFDPAPSPKQTTSTLVTVATINLSQETSTETDLLLTTSPAAPSTTPNFKDASSVTSDGPTTFEETALPESSSAPVEILTTVTLIPIEASTSQTKDLSTASTQSSPVVQTSTSASTAPFTSIHAVGSPISNPPSPETTPGGAGNTSMQVPNSVSITSTSVVSQSSQDEAQSTAPFDSANSLSLTSSTTTSTTTQFTTTTLTKGTTTSTVTLSAKSSTQTQTIIGKLTGGGSAPGNSIIETITSGGSTYTTTETGPGSTMTRSVAINPAFSNPASFVPHLSSNTANGLTTALSASSACTCPTPHTITVTQTFSPLPSTASFTPQIPPSDSFVGVPDTSSAIETTTSSKNSDVPEPAQFTTRSYSSLPSFSSTIIPIYPSLLSVVASLSKATPYPNSTIPVRSSGSLLGTAIQPSSSSSLSRGSSYLPSGNHLSVTPVPQSTSPLTFTSAADFHKVSGGTEGVALIVGFVALILLF